MPISMKVLTQLLVGLVLGIVTVLANDTSWLNGLPPWVGVVVGPVVAQSLAAFAAWLKRETNPAPSSFGQ